MTSSRAVLFDLYGTLVDLEIDETSAELWHRVADYLASPDAPQEIERSYQALCDSWKAKTPGGESVLARVFPELIAQHGRNDASSVAELSRIFRRASRIRLDERSFVRPLLSELDARGYKTGIVSNTEALLTRVDLEDLGLSDTVGTIVLSSDVGAEKPRSEPFLTALLALGVRAENALFIGDSFTADVTGATHTGIRAMHLNGTLRESIMLEGHYLGEYPPTLEAIRTGIARFERIADSKAE